MYIGERSLYLFPVCLRKRSIVVCLPSFINALPYVHSFLFHLSYPVLIVLNSHNVEQ